MPHESDVKIASPAVVKAIKILDYLAENPDSGVTEIAAALKINKSTCFNILQALAGESVVIKDKRFPVYRLGPKLVELGTATRRTSSQIKRISNSLRPLVNELGIAAVISQPLPADRGFVVVDRVLPVGGDAISAPIGHVYPVTAPATGRAFLAHRDISEVIANVHGIPGVAERDVLAMAESLDKVRANGYGWSVGEFQADTNAVAVAITLEDGDVFAILCLIGRPDRFPYDNIKDYGRILLEFSKSIAADLMSSRLDITQRLQ